MCVYMQIDTQTCRQIDKTDRFKRKKCININGWINRQAIREKHVPEYGLCCVLHHYHSIWQMPDNDVIMKQRNDIIGNNIIVVIITYSYYSSEGKPNHYQNIAIVPISFIIVFIIFIFPLFFFSLPYSTLFPLSQTSSMSAYTFFTSNSIKICK